MKCTGTQIAVTDQIPWANRWMIRDNDVSDISSKRCALKFTNLGEPCYYTLNHTFLRCVFFFRGKAISNGICNMTNDIEGSLALALEIASVKMFFLDASL